ncbi:hypothetical protein ES703_40773 [subsurface metagenome]
MGKSKRILIVDRDTDFACQLTNFLLAGGYSNIESVNSYRDALISIRQNHFDIVLMDIFGPDMKGLDYAWEIKCLKPETKTFLMIEPEHQELINGRIKEKVKFDCLTKSTITKNLLGYLRG